MLKAILYPSRESVAREALIMGTLPSKLNDQPVAYFWKEVLAPDKFIDANGTSHEVTPDRINSLVANTKKAMKNGFKPFLPTKHFGKDEVPSATDNLGYLMDNFKINDRGGLEVLHQFIGEDAIKAASRNESSIMTLVDYEDEHGNKYDEVIHHNAVIPNPQLKNLKGFTPAIAASRGAVESVVLTTAAPTGSNDMADLKPLREHLKLAADVKDEEVITKAIENLKNADTAIQTEKDKNLTLSRSLPKQVDPAILNDWKELKLGRIDLAVEKGDMPQHVGDKLKAALEKDGKPVGLLLSASPDLDGKMPVDFVLGLFTDAKLGIAAGEQSDVQQDMVLGRITPGLTKENKELADQIAADLKLAQDYQAKQLKARGIAS